MSTEIISPSPAGVAAGADRAGFGQLLHAEWTKFRTVRGWVIGMIVAALLTVLVSILTASGSSIGCQNDNGVQETGPACLPYIPHGPGGEVVTDSSYFVHQPLAGNGTITARVTSLTGMYANLTGGPVQVGEGPTMKPGVMSWSKAGIIIKENTSQGSAYAAMMVTGSNGVRMQWDYVNDTPGLPGSPSASSSRWLRLVRDGGMITGYDSADGTHWTQVGTAALPALTSTGQASTVQAGLFAAGIGTENPTVATGVFRHIGLSWPATRWTGTNVGGVNGVNGASGPGTFRQSAGTVTVTGYGDISPLIPPDGATSIQRALAGTALGLISLIVVAAMFITAEYRRGLIRVSLTAAPRRGRLLAAKAVVIGAVGFVTGLIAATISLALGAHTLTRTGTPLWPVPALTRARMLAGTGALFAVAAVLALAIGTIWRRSAAAVAAGIVVIFVPYLLVVLPSLQPGPGGPVGGGLSLAGREWLLRITPAAGFSVQQAVPQFSQVAGVFYFPAAGYYPLATWAGFAVECAWAAAGLVLAFYLLQRRDA
jgi:ABC-type transport system involved in multi-copper enzyme maturation permease subunit